MKIRCKIHARKSDAKNMEIIKNWSQKWTQNISNSIKNKIPKIKEKIRLRLLWYGGGSGQGTLGTLETIGTPGTSGTPGVHLWRQPLATDGLPRCYMCYSVAPFQSLPYVSVGAARHRLQPSCDVTKRVQNSREHCNAIKLERGLKRYKNLGSTETVQNYNEDGISWRTNTIESEESTETVGKPR